MENLVGVEYADGRTLPQLENEKDQNLFGYVEENTKDIATLEKWVGDVDKVYYGTNDAKMSLATIIGNYNKVLGKEKDYVYSTDPFVDISSAIGDMPKLWNDYDAALSKNQHSLVDTILDFKSRYDDYATKEVNPELQDLRHDVNDINSTIGNKWTDALSI